MNTVSTAANFRKGQGLGVGAGGKSAVGQIHCVGGVAIHMGDLTAAFCTELEGAVFFVSKSLGNIARAVFIGLHRQTLVDKAPLAGIAAVAEFQRVAGACVAGIDDQVGCAWVNAVFVQLISLHHFRRAGKMYRRKQCKQDAQKHNK